MSSQYHLKYKVKRVSLTLFLIFIFGMGFTACSDADLNSESKSEDSVEKPPEGTKLFFNVFGDSTNGEIYYTDLITKALTAGIADLNLHVGDQISNPEHYVEWPYTKSLSSRLEYKSTFYVTIGNHDVNDAESLNQMRRFYPVIPEEGYYSFVKGDVFFIVLNSEEIGTPGTLTATQLTWIEDQLSSASALHSDSIVAAIHQPPFPQNKHIKDRLANWNDLHQLFVTYGVDVVFSGHEHNFTHTVQDGIDYIITGGAGSKLSELGNGEEPYYHYTQVSVLSDRFFIRIIDLYGRTRESFEINF